MFNQDAKAARQKACMQQYLMYFGVFLTLAIIIIIILAVMGVFDSSSS